MNLKERQVNNVLPHIGSYNRDDCIFLLNAVAPEFEDISNKEYLIQTGKKHYSEMISQEDVPSNEYLDLFREFTETYKHRLASEIMYLAQKIVEIKGDDITIASLARAGTPIGVLVHRAITKFFNKNSAHYSLSIVRDKGIDFNALSHIVYVDERPSSSIVFIDGWTGKGAINKELKSTMSEWNKNNEGAQISDELFVVSDIGCVADYSATIEDYVIPSGILNSVVSGLISRTIINTENSDTGFHSCVTYNHLKDYDLTNWFVNEITDCMSLDDIAVESNTGKAKQKIKIDAYLSSLKEEYGVTDINRIKPSIAEATRALLRRVPDLLLVQDINCPHVKHILLIAKSKNVKIEVRPDMPYNAISLIKDVV